jgi:protein TonB
MAVRLIDPAELTALTVAARRAAEPAPQPEPATPTPPTPTPEPPRPEPPEPDPEPEPEPETLAPAFDPVAPLALNAPDPLAIPLEAPPEPLPDLTSLLRLPASTTLETVAPPPPRPASHRPPAPSATATATPTTAATPRAASAPEAGAEAVADYRAAVRAAVARAQVYPRAARSRGVEGAAVLHLALGPDGRLRNARIAQSSGAAVLDRACLDAARNARLPAPPPGLRATDLQFTVTVQFQIAGN